MMKIMVYIKDMPDDTDAINFLGGMEDPNRMTHGCEAMIAALFLKEKIPVDITVLSVGLLKNISCLRYAFALGADRAVLLQTEVCHEPFIIAKIMQAYIQKENPALIFASHAPDEEEGAQTALILAGLLDYPQAAFVSAFESVRAQSLVAVKDHNEGIEVVEIFFPAVVTVNRSFPAKYTPDTRAIQQAYQKPLTVLPVDKEKFMTPRTVKIQADYLENTHCWLPSTQALWGALLQRRLS